MVRAALSSRVPGSVTAVAGWILALGLLAASTAQARTVTLPAPQEPKAGSLVPGLAVRYFYRIYDDVGMFADRDPAEGVPGPPLPNLDYATGADLVLTSTHYDGVGAHISGYIHLAKTGTYQFAFLSNDGVRLHLSGQLVVEDPDVHADRYSPVADVVVSTPGWYPLIVWYFEKRNTSTLRMFWREPGTPSDADMVIVPASAFGHVKP